MTNQNTGFSIKQQKLHLNALDAMFNAQQTELKRILKIMEESQLETQKINDEIAACSQRINEIHDDKNEEKDTLLQLRTELEERESTITSKLNSMAESISSISNVSNDQLQTILTNISETIAGIETYEVPSDLADEPMERAFTPSPEFKPNEIDEEAVAYDIQMIQIGNGSTDLKLSSNDNGEEICTLTNKMGGILLNKTGGEDGWIIEGGVDGESLNFHYNSLQNSPLKINPSGIEVSRLNMGGHTVTDIATTINEETINNKTIPTTASIIKYINANIKKAGVMNQLKSIPSSTEEISTDTESLTLGISVEAFASSSREPFMETSSMDPVTESLEGVSMDSLEVPTMKDCNIGIVDVGEGKTLLIENDTNTISFRDADKIITPKFTYDNGLEISDRFALRNDIGTLCVYQGSETDLIGKFVKVTKNIRQQDDLFIPEVKTPTEANSDIFGIIKQKIETRYVYNNMIYTLDPTLTYVLVVSQGILKIPKIKGDIKTGEVLLADSKGNPTSNYGKAADSNTSSKNKLREIYQCVKKCIPMLKVLAFDGDDMFVQVLNG